MSAYTDPSGEVYNYTYSPGGMRIAKEHNGSVERYYYDNGKIVNEANGNGSLTARNVFGIEGIAARTNAGQTTQYMIKNGHNDVVGTCDGTTVSARYDYDAYGAAAQTEQFAHNPFRYCGEYFDYESGLIYLRARYYDPALGRFTQEDPAKDGGNWYIYAGNNPIKFIDPSGLRLILKGTGGEVSKIWGAIKDMSADDIELVQQKDANGNLIDSYEVFLRGEVNGICQNGTNLVRKIINSDKTSTVQITNGVNYEQDVNPANAINGKGSDTEVYFNPDSNPDILTKDPVTGNVAGAKRPAFIGLAHELIHAERSMRGKAIDYSEMADYKYQTSRTKWTWGPLWGYDYTYTTENVPKEELATVGLGYNNWWGDITENMIRAEHGLRLRGAY